MDALSSGLKELPDISYCYFQKNHISDLGAKHLLPALNKNLKILDLSDNVFGEQGSYLIYRYLTQYDIR
jgi:Ran GTPase-activating protein (RanGAP) involved in mRNA processing and transport